MSDSAVRQLEQRRFGRSRIDVPVEFTTSDSGETFSGTGKNISLGGIFIETHRIVAFGMEIRVRIRLSWSPRAVDRAGDRPVDACRRHGRPVRLDERSGDPRHNRVRAGEHCVRSLPTERR